MAKRSRGDVTVALTGVSSTAAVGTLRSVGATTLVDTLTPDWQVVFHLGRTAAGVVTIVRLEVQPTGSVPAEGVTAAVISKIRFARARRYVRYEAVVARQAVRPQAGRQSSRGRPHRLTLQAYRAIVARHDTLQAQGDPHAGKTLFAQLKKEGVTSSWSTVRNWLSRSPFPPALHGSARLTITARGRLSD